MTTHQIGPFNVRQYEDTVDFWTVDGPGFRPGHLFSSQKSAIKAARWRNSATFKIRRASIALLAALIRKFRAIQGNRRETMDRFRNDLAAEICKQDCQ